MNKLLLTSLVAVFATVSANAATNYFVGGNAAIAMDSEHATLLSVAPEFGWKYNEDWDLGVMAHFGYDHEYLMANYGVKGDAYSYGAAAFARYKVAEMGGFKLLLKGAVGVDLMTGAPEDSNIDTETLTSINASIIPMITYDVSESFTLYANLNFLGVHAGYTFENEDMGLGDSWRLGAVVDANNLANTGNFQIGFTYNF